MPIMSYLAYPAEGRKEELLAALESIPQCEVRVAADQDLLVLVTDTGGTEEERALTDRLHGLESLALLALVAGFDDPDTEPGTDPRRNTAPPLPTDSHGGDQ